MNEKHTPAFDSEQAPLDLAVVFRLFVHDTTTFGDIVEVPTGTQDDDQHRLFVLDKTKLPEPIKTLFEQHGIDSVRSIPPYPLDGVYTGPRVIVNTTPDKHGIGYSMYIETLAAGVRAEKFMYGNFSDDDETSGANLSDVDEVHLLQLPNELGVDDIDQLHGFAVSLHHALREK